MELNLTEINRVLSCHKCKEFHDQLITKKEFDIIQQLLWIKWEYNNFKRIKPSYKKDYVLKKLCCTASYLCERYYYYV